MDLSLRPAPGATTGPWRREITARVIRAAGKTTDKAAFGARDEIRAAMRSQRLGNLANTIGATSDLKKGRPQGRGGSEGLDIAGFVTASIRSQRTAGALKAYLDQDQTEINPVAGKYLWIATGEIPRRAGRRSMTPALYRSSGLENTIGPLTFVQGKHPGMAFYVVESTTIQLARQGKAKRLPKRGRVGAGRAHVGIVAFIGIRRTRRSRRVHPAQIAAAWQRRLPSLMSAALA